MLENMKELYAYYGFLSGEITMDKLVFRNDLIREECQEIQQALDSQDPEEWVDGHIDLIVVAIGNLLIAGVDVDRAWKEVLRANQSKLVGVKPGREQSKGFDVIKGSDWVKPSHKGNYGRLDGIFQSRA